MTKFIIKRNDKMYYQGGPKMSYTEDRALAQRFHSRAFAESLAYENEVVIPDVPEPEIVEAPAPSDDRTEKPKRKPRKKKGEPTGE